MLIFYICIQMFLMMKTNQVSSFFHDQIGHVYLKFTISDHMVNNRLCNLTPPGSFEHTFVFLFCFIMFEELRHFIIVSTLYPHCFHSTKGQMNNKKQTQERTFSDIRWSTGDTDMKKLFFWGGRSSSSNLPLLWPLKQLYTLHLLHFPHKLQPAYCKTKTLFLDLNE